MQRLNSHLRKSESKKVSWIEQLKKPLLMTELDACYRGDFFMDARVKPGHDGLN